MVTNLLMDDLLPAIIWLAASAFIVRCSIHICRQCFSDDFISAQLLHTTLIAISVIVVGLTIPAGCGLLTPTSGLLGPCAVALVSLRLVRSHCDRDKMQSTLQRPDYQATIAWVFIAGWIAGNSIVNGVSQIPVDWDTLMYHLPYIDHWLQTGTFAATESPRWSNPANSEVLGLWFAVSFSGDFLVPLSNLPVVVLWTASAIEIGRRFGLTGAWAHLTAIACIAVHTTIHETDDASNDLLVPACFMAAICYAIRFRDKPDRSNLTMFGAAIGLLAGTKYFGAGYALLIGIAFAALCWQRYRLRFTLEVGTKAIAVSLVLGGYWYARNYLLTGHILYPSGSDDLHRRIPHPDLSQTTLLGNGNPEVPNLLLEAVWRLCGPVHYTALLLLPAVCLILLITRLDDRTRLRHHALLTFLLTGTAVLTLVTPMLVEDQPDTLNHLRWGYTPVRYALCFLSLLTLTGSVCMKQIADLLPGGMRWVLTRGLACVVAGQLLYRFSRSGANGFPTPMPLQEMLALPTAGLALFGFAYLGYVACSRWPRYRVVLFGAGILGFSVLVCLAAQRWHRNFAPHFDNFYSTNYFTSSGTKAKRMLVLDERSYPFFGSMRQNYLLQPMVYDSVDETKRLMIRHQLSCVATRVENNKKLARYRPSWQDLALDKTFKLVGKGTGLRIFERTSVETGQEAPAEVAHMHPVQNRSGRTRVTLP